MKICKRGIIEHLLLLIFLTLGSRVFRRSHNPSHAPSVFCRLTPFGELTVALIVAKAKIHVVCIECA